MSQEKFEQSTADIPPEQRRREKHTFVASPVNKEAEHLMEAEYKEIRAGVWQKVPGSEKDLGPINKEPKEKK